MEKTSFCWWELTLRNKRTLFKLLWKSNVRILLWLSCSFIADVEMCFIIGAIFMGVMIWYNWNWSCPKQKLLAAHLLKVDWNIFFQCHQHWKSGRIFTPELRKHHAACRIQQSYLKKKRCQVPSSLPRKGEYYISLLNSMNSFAFPRGLNFVVSADIWFSKNGQKNK